MRVLSFPPAIGRKITATWSGPRGFPKSGYDFGAARQRTPFAVARAAL
jgi:hypothetical protein